MNLLHFKLYFPVNFIFILFLFAFPFVVWFSFALYLSFLSLFFVFVNVLCVFVVILFFKYVNSILYLCTLDWSYRLRHSLGNEKKTTFFTLLFHFVILIFSCTSSYSSICFSLWLSSLSQKFWIFKNLYTVLIYLF